MFEQENQKAQNGDGHTWGRPENGGSPWFDRRNESSSQLPSVGSQGKGKIRGRRILGFMRGLRFSARIAYFIREQL